MAFTRYHNTLNSNLHNQPLFITEMMMMMLEEFSNSKPGLSYIKHLTALSKCSYPLPALPVLELWSHGGGTLVPILTARL